MKYAQLQQSVGLLVIVGHVIIILMIFFYFSRGGLLFEEMTTSLALISPMLAVYTTAIIKQFQQSKYQEDAEGLMLSGPFIAITFVFPTIYLILIGAFVVFRANRTVFTSFNQFSATLGILESVFGVYAGQTLSALFDIRSSKHKTGTSRRAR
jgi:hypothetical protein